jgi:predicted lactoylglutathione lyase
MTTKIFVNLPVRDLDRSIDFFKKLGYTFNEQFTDATAACLVISESIYAMLLTENRFKDFLPKGKQMSDATKTTEVLLALSCESKEKVHEIVDLAISAGATEARPAEDHGFMFARSFNDLDGHVWEIFWMDPAGIPQQ